MKRIPIIGLIVLMLGMPIPVMAQSATPSATPAAATGDFARLVDIGGRKVYMECHGQGSPTVVLVAGGGSSARYWTDDLLHPDAPRTMVMPEVAKFTRVCAYDRPGTYAEINGEIVPSRSDPVAQPRTFTEMVDELHALLQAAEVPGPYVLAGHSNGGFISRFYAATYPDEVIGLILVDAYSELLEDVMPPEKWAALVRLNQEMGSDVVHQIPGYGDAESTGYGADNAVVREAVAKSPLRPMPLAVLAHGKPFSVPEGTQGFAPGELERYLLAGNEAQAALVPNARFTVATESGHDIHQDQPELVIEAIRQVVEGVRHPDTWYDLTSPLREASGQATPVAPPGVTARTTALLVTAIHDPLRVTGSDGMVHLEYDLVLTNVFTSPVTVTTIEVLTPDGQSLLRLEGDALEAMTQPLFGRTPTDVVPQSGALAAMLDVVVPPDQVPQRLTHRITYTLAPEAPVSTIIGSHEVAGPELAVDPFVPVVIAPPLRGTGWLNANGCCDASAHRSFRIAVDGSHLVKSETFAIDWIRIVDDRMFTGDGTGNEDYVAFGAEVLAVADGTVVFVRDGIPEDTPNEPPTTVHQPLDYGGNEVVLELEPGVFAFYAHLQPGSIRVQIGETVTTGQVLGLLGNTGNSTAPHLHFELADGPDVLTANSLPFVIDQYTLVGSVAPESTASDIQVVGTPAPQTATLPLDLTVADFP